MPGHVDPPQEHGLMMNRFELHHRLIQRARDLRKISTQSERMLWERLRDRRLGGYKWRRQHVLNNFIVDFYCPQCGLIVEVHGHVHNEHHVIERDIRRADELSAGGLVVLCVSNANVLTRTDEVCAELLEYCKRRRRYRDDLPYSV